MAGRVVVMCFVATVLASSVNAQQQHDSGCAVDPDVVDHG